MNKGFYSIPKNRTYEAPLSASYAKSASYAITASYAMNGGGVNPTSGRVPYNNAGTFDDSIITYDSVNSFIGIATIPTDMLTVAGNVNFKLDPSVTGRGYFRIVDNDKPSYIQAGFGNLFINHNVIYNQSGDGLIRYVTNGSGSTLQFEPTTGDIVFLTYPFGTSGSVATGLTRFRVQNNGNIGIGLNSPAFKLDVSGSGRFTNNLTVTGSFTVITGSSIELQVTNTGVRIGNIITDIHTVTGSLSISGSITGSLFGTATTASYILNAVSSSFASTASFAQSATVFPFTGSAIISGSLTVTGSTNINGGTGATLLSTNADTLVITGSLITSGSSTTIGTQVISGSLTVVTGSSIELQVTNTGVRIGNLVTDTHNITGSVRITGSLVMSPTSSFVFPLTASASPATGNAYWSGSFLFIYDGVQYRSASFA